jgi:hypothetical protein
VFSEKDHVDDSQTIERDREETEREKETKDSNRSLHLSGTKTNKQQENKKEILKPPNLPALSD